MKNPVLQRIREIIEFYGVSKRKFAEDIGITQSTLSSLFLRDSDPSSTLLRSILNKHGEINPTWLLTGQGEMLKRGTNISQSVIGNSNISAIGNASGSISNHQLKEPDVPYGETSKEEQKLIYQLEMKNKEIELKDKEIGLKDKEIEMLHKVIEEKERFIELLLSTKK